MWYLQQVPLVGGENSKAPRCFSSSPQESQAIFNILIYLILLNDLYIETPISKNSSKDMVPDFLFL